VDPQGTRRSLGSRLSRSRVTSHACGARDRSTGLIPALRFGPDGLLRSSHAAWARVVPDARPSDDVRSRRSCAPRQPAASARGSPCPAASSRRAASFDGVIPALRFGLDGLLQSSHAAWARVVPDARPSDDGRSRDFVARTVSESPVRDDRE